MMDHNVGNYCKDTGAEHLWEMFAEQGCINVECSDCGVKVAEFVASKALNMGSVPVRVDFPWCADGTPQRLDISPRL